MDRSTFDSCQSKQLTEIIHVHARAPTFGDGQRWAPLIPQNIQADAAIRVDVWVVDACREVDLGRLERVVGGEMDSQEKDTSGVGRVALERRVSTS